MNHLAKEQNPYLRQHAENPVAWYPWGPEAFAKAQAENKPIFLSVGYSTCHWCHVMAHESFEDAGIAQILNEHFISVKVDREERPDVDRVYMAFVQATAGQGGWPMSVWLTPDLKPFYGGTYFPPQDRYGRPGFSTLLRRIAQLWGTDQEAIVRQSSQIIEQLALSVSGSAGADGSLKGEEALDHGFAAFRAKFDAEQGGFGGAPKFPRPSVLNFLFRYDDRRGKEEARQMALFTLDKMAAGGMYDHLGGGFHRYSVDALWHVPHFEKMLYDQAQLATAYLEAHQITHESHYAAITRSILDYVRHDLTSQAGGFYAAEDADSVLEENPKAHAEGAFYVWTLQEIEETLGEDAAFFAAHYGVEKDGNAPAGSDPHGEFTGKNILIERKPPVRKDIKRLIGCRERLLARRAKRPRPHRDEKVITSWNGLMISAFARAGRILHEPAYIAAGARAADFIFKNLYDAQRGRLLRCWCEGAAKVEGFADDYAFLIAGLLDLFEADGVARWLDLALQLQETMDALFWDAREGGYFSTSGEDPTVLIRSREEYDGAEPAPGSIAVSNLIRLADLLDRPALREQAAKVVAVAATSLMKMPVAVPQLLAASIALLEPPRHLVVVGKESAGGTRSLWEEVNRHYLPQATLIRVDPGHLPAVLQKGFLKNMRAAEGHATAYYCENFACNLPVSEAKELARLLEKRGSPGGT